MSDTTVLVVDEDDAVRGETVEALRSGLDGATILTASSPAAARDVLDAERVDVLVVGDSFAAGEGLELIEYVRSLGTAIGCVLYTDRTEIDTATFEETVVEFVPRGESGAEAQLIALVEQAGPKQRQAAYPIPDDEDDRLAAVDAYVPDGDALADPFQRITHLAATHFGVEVASINVIGRQTQEFLATSGPLWPPGAREDSICTHTIVHEERSMAIEDVREDPRFADNETLRDAEIVAYLGAIVRTPEGHALGSLCVYDDEPRQFSAADREFLETLADLLVDVLVLARADDTPAVTGDEGHDP